MNWGKHFHCQSSGSMDTTGVWVCRSEDSSYKKKKNESEDEKGLLIKRSETSVRLEAGGRCKHTELRFSTPRSICSTSSLLSDCQGQFRLFLTCAMVFFCFFYHSNTVCTHQTSHLKLFMPAPVDPIVFSPSLLS